MFYQKYKIWKYDLDLFNYTTKADLKGATGVDTSNLVLNSDLATLKAEVDRIDTDEVNTVPDDLSKLRNVLDNYVVKSIYDKLVT